MVKSHAPRRLTLREAIDDVGWFWSVFTALANAPSVLSLLQMVFVEHRLIDALQWIVDGYNDIAAKLGAVCEPVLQPAVDWLNRVFDWELVLAPHWRPFFILTMVLVAGFLRQAWRSAETVSAEFSTTATTLKARTEIAVIGVGAGVGALLGAVTSGLLPLDGAWWVQGLAAAIPTALVFFSAGLFMLLRDIFFSKPGEKPRGLLLLLNTSGFTLMLAPALVLGAASFALGAGASFFPGLALGAGIVSIGLIIIAAGAATLVQALRTGDRMWSRVGLTILGGFVAAGSILAADAAVKAIESLNSL